MVFQLFIDEYTDVSVAKYMAFCVRYNSKYRCTIVVDFLRITEVTKTTAEDLYMCTKEFLQKVGLNLNKLIGIGTDGANNLCGKNNLLYTLLKQNVPTLQLVPCVCYSLYICAAQKRLPNYHRQLNFY